MTLRIGVVGMGGDDGAPHRYLLNAPNAEPQILESKMEGLPVPPNAMFAVHSGGGGGWGAPEKRDPASRERDVVNELVSADNKDRRT